MRMRDEAAGAPARSELLESVPTISGCIQALITLTMDSSCLQVERFARISSVHVPELEGTLTASGALAAAGYTRTCNATLRVALCIRAAACGTRQYSAGTMHMRMPIS